MKKETKYLIALAALIGVVLFFVFKQKQESDKEAKGETAPKENKGNKGKGDDANAGDDGETGTHKSGVMSSIASTKFPNDQYAYERNPNKVTAPVVINCCGCSGRGTHMGKEIGYSYGIEPVAERPTTMSAGWYDREPVAETPTTMSAGKKPIPPVSIGEVKALQYEKLESNGKEVRML